MGWIPLADILVAVVIAAWLRIAVLGPATRLMSPARRLVTRATGRVLVGALLAALLIGSQLVTLLGPMGAPIKAVVGVIEVVGCVFVLERYTAVQLRREADGRPVGMFEYLLLVAPRRPRLGSRRRGSGTARISGFNR